MGDRVELGVGLEVWLLNQFVPNYMFDYCFTITCYYTEPKKVRKMIYDEDKFELPTESLRLCIPPHMSAARSKLNFVRGGPSMLIRIKQLSVEVL